MLPAALVVDDHLVFAEALAATLEDRAGYRAVAAGTMRDAVALAESIEFDVTVVGLHLSDGDALDLVARLRELRPNGRVVVLTAYPWPWLAQRVLAAGAVGVLGKGCPLARILAAIRTARVDAPVVDGDVGPPVVELTEREHDVLRELSRGHDAGRTAGVLGISVHTARSHIKSVLGKLGVHSQLEAVITAHRLGLITLGGGWREPAPTTSSQAGGAGSTRIGVTP